MPIFNLSAFSVAIAAFDAAVQLNFPFQLVNIVDVDIEDDDGSISSADLSSTNVRIGDDDQGAITDISYRAITMQSSDGGDAVVVEVAIIERANVADYLIVPISRADGRIAENIQSAAGDYQAGAEFDLPALSLVADDGGQNTAPTAGNDTATTNEDSSIAIDLLGNDTDLENDDLTVTVLGTPENGSIAFDGEEYVYTPNANFSGTDTFDYTISDGELTSTATVTVTVNPVNDAPFADNDSVTTDEDTAISIPVLDNDSDVDSSLVINSFASGDNGTVTEGVNGELIYTPNANFSGEDSFIYGVFDGEFGSFATVTVTVNPVNDAPVAGDDSESAEFETAAVLQLLSNDSDVENDDLTITSVDAISSGAVEIAADGKSVTYTPADGFSGQATFDYTISDGDETSTASVTVTVAGPDNRAPVAGDDSATVSEDGSVAIDLLENDSDPDGDNLVVTLGDASNGSVVFDGEEYVYTPNADYEGNDSFTYTISDGALSDQATVNIFVEAVNDAPTVSNDAVEVAEDGAINIDLAALGSDIDTASLSVSLNGDPANGSIQLNDGGTYTYAPNANFNGSDTINFSVSDGELSANGSVAVTVTPVNDAPVAGNDEVETAEDTSINIDLAALGSDIDGDDLTITLGSGPTNGSLELNDGGTYTYTPNTDFNGSDVINFTVSDGAESASGEVEINVTPVNDNPEASDGAVETAEDAPIIIDLAALGSDVDGDDLTITVDGEPSNGSIVLNDSGTYTYTPDADFNGADVVNFTVSDGELTDSGVVTVTVNPVNDAPVAGDDSESAEFETAAVLQLLSNDSDVENDDLTITSVDAISSGAVEIAADGKSVTYTPADGFSGQATFDYTISDGDETSTASVTVTVAGPGNRAPVAGDDSATVSEDGSVAIDLLENDSDPDGDNLVVTLGDASNGSIVFDGEEYVYTPNADYEGSDSFTYTISDGELTDSGVVTVTVNPVNDAPVAGDDSESAEFETAAVLQLLSNDSDVENDDLTITSVDAISSGAVEIAADGKSVTYTPADGFSGQATFDYTISDGDETSTASVTVTVAGPDNRAPVAGDDSATVSEDGSVAIDLLENDSDPDGDNLVVTLGDASNGSVVFDGEEYVYTPNADYEGSDSFTYTISDGALSDQATVNIFVEAVNDAPVAAVIADIDINEDDAAVNVDLLEGATDIDDAVITLAAVSASWSGGVLSVTQTASGFSFDPSQLGADLNDGDLAAITVDYQISDGEAVVDASLQINVAGADDIVDPGPVLVMGTDSNNLLSGTDADEIIVSGAGTYDRLFGGGGSDHFVFGDETSNGTRERDVIYDFNTADDTICLETADYGVRVIGSTGLISVGEDLIYVRGTGITLEALENSIEVGCNFDLA